MQTPYERHQQLGHKTCDYSPNGIDIIEVCQHDACGMRFLHRGTLDKANPPRPILLDYRTWDVERMIKAGTWSK